MKRPFEECLTSSESEGELVCLQDEPLLELLQQRPNMSMDAFFVSQIRKCYPTVADEVLYLAFNDLCSMIIEKSYIRRDYSNWYRVYEENKTLIMISRPSSNEQMELFIDFLILVDIYDKVYGSDNSEYTVSSVARSVYNFLSQDDILQREVYLLQNIVNRKLQ